MNAATFPMTDWTPCEPTARLDYAESSVPRVVLQAFPEQIEPLPPPPFELVPAAAREPWRVPWAFFLSVTMTLAMVALACR